MADKTKSPNDQWWVEQHHDEFKVSRGSQRPDTKTEPGQRLRKVHGPFRTQADAEKYAQRSESRTMRAKHSKRVK